jgi:hypothetical protein
MSLLAGVSPGGINSILGGHKTAEVFSDSKSSALRVSSPLLACMWSLTAIYFFSVAEIASSLSSQTDKTEK